VKWVRRPARMHAHKANAAAAEAYAAVLAKAAAELEEADADAALEWDEGKMGALSRADGGAAADKLSDAGKVYRLNKKM